MTTRAVLDETIAQAPLAEVCWQMQAPAFTLCPMQGFQLRRYLGPKWVALGGLIGVACDDAGRIPWEGGAGAERQRDSAVEMVDAAPMDSGGVAGPDAAADARGDSGGSLPVGLEVRPDNQRCLPKSPPAALLSQTGCFAGTPPAPDAALIPYDVAVPLWSDGADKQRFLALANDTQIQLRDDGDFELPVGAIAIKTFGRAGKNLETRFLVRGSDGTYDAYTYVWSEDQSDAALTLTGTELGLVGEDSWQVPSREQCFACHTERASMSLGLEAIQLNHDMTYPSTRVRANQLHTFEALGLLAEPLSDNQRTRALSTEAGSTEERAKAYLHSNCASCHRPGGAGFGALDLRYLTELRFMNVCNALPMHSDGAIANARLLAPADPSRSLLAQRMRSLATNFRMPPLGSAVVDDQGVALVEAWIDALSGCPD